MCTVVVDAQLADPGFQVAGQPLPGPALRMETEPAHHPLSGIDGHLVETSGELLITPAVQHRLEHVTGDE